MHLRAFVMQRLAADAAPSLARAQRSEVLARDRERPREELDLDAPDVLVFQSVFHREVDVHDRVFLLRARRLQRDLDRARGGESA